ncbi:hypothetical protein, partial [Microvirga splendida]|uniref:hypothetical protein n=1 Tax=Microvirga splendida TaxID=2795727 RepID=UPI001AEEA229
MVSKFHYYVLALGGLAVLSFILYDSQSSTSGSIHPGTQATLTSRIGPNARVQETSGLYKDERSSNEEMDLSLLPMTNRNLSE